MTFVTCPICGASFDSELSPAMPFCSERCRYIDLGKWINEQYTLPLDPERDDPE